MAKAEVEVAEVAGAAELLGEVGAPAGEAGEAVVAVAADVGMEAEAAREGGGAGEAAVAEETPQHRTRCICRQPSSRAPPALLPRSLDPQPALTAPPLFASVVGHTAPCLPVGLALENDSSVSLPPPTTTSSSLPLSLPQPRQRSSRAAVLYGCRWGALSGREGGRGSRGGPQCRSSRREQEGAVTINPSQPSQAPPGDLRSPINMH